MNFEMSKSDSDTEISSTGESESDDEMRDPQLGETPRRSVKRETALNCSQCNRHFSDNEEFSQHIATHSQDRISADYLGTLHGGSGLDHGHASAALEAGKVGFWMDQEFSHKENTLACKLCNKTFGTRYDLEMHMQGYHRDERNYRTGEKNYHGEVLSYQRDERNYHLNQPVYHTDIPNITQSDVLNYHRDSEKIDNKFDQNYHREALNYHLNVPIYLRDMQKIDQSDVQRIDHTDVQRTDHRDVQRTDHRDIQRTDHRDVQTIDQRDVQINDLADVQNYSRDNQSYNRDSHEAFFLNYFPDVKGYHQEEQNYKRYERTDANDKQLSHRDEPAGHVDVEMGCRIDELIEPRDGQTGNRVGQADHIDKPSDHGDHPAVQQSNHGYLNLMSDLKRDQTDDSDEESCEESNDPFNESTAEKERANDIDDKCQQSELSCSDCGKRFSKANNLRQHMRIHGERKYECDQCSKQFIEPGKLRRHVRTHTGEKPFVCKQCSKAFTDLSYLTRHVKKVHPGKGTKNQEGCRNDSGGEPSDGTFRQIEDVLKVPIKKEAGFFCSECGKLFMEEMDISEHVKMSHAETNTHVEKKFITNCNEFVSETEDLKKRLEMVFEERVVVQSSQKNLVPEDSTPTGAEKSFQCSRCSKSFTRRRSLRNHMLSHAGKSDESLATPESRRLGSGEKLFACSQCEKSFTRNDNLKQHMLAHAGIKAFDCTRCSMSFARKSKLKLHVRSCPRNKLSAYDQRTVVKPIPVIMIKPSRATTDDNTKKKKVPTATLR